MGLQVVPHAFCRVCGTDHQATASCPGELHATGAERPGWRVNVETPFGNEAIGVLLAPSYDQWRARIVTYPNVLWTAPGGGGTLKFVGETPEQAEAQAIRFVEEHVRRKRYLRRDAVVSVRAVHVAQARPAAPHPRGPATAAILRKRRCLPIRFGTDRASVRGVTVNLSAEGMFVGAPLPLEEGRSLRLHLYLEGNTLPLRGLVMWNRERGEPDRPAGMGILLSQPPLLYQSFVAGLP